jgi:hypothetical protein
MAPTCAFDANGGVFVFVIDASESILDADWRRIENILPKIVSAIQAKSPQSTFSVVVFWDKLQVFYPVNTDAATTINIINNEIYHGKGGTNTEAGLLAGQATFLNDGKPHTLILLTDGNPTIYLKDAEVALADTTTAANNIKASGTFIVSIGILNAVSRSVATSLKENIQTWASSPQYVYSLEDYDVLLSMVDQIVNNIECISPRATTNPTSTPTQLPGSAGYPCALPSAALNYALITSGNAKISAHTVYRAVHVGGILFDGTLWSQTVISSNNQNQASWIKTLGTPVAVAGSTLEIKGGYTTGGTGALDFAAYEWLARNAKSSTSGSFKVVVMTTGGTFNTYSFNNGGQGSDNGNTLVIFNTTADIILDKTTDGRQFGPSVIAPFSKVTLKGQAGFVDGLVVAREFTDDNENAGSLQMHGNGYKGPITCI